MVDSNPDLVLLDVLTGGLFSKWYTSALHNGKSIFIMLFQLIKGFIWYIVLCVAAVMLENFRAI